MLKFVADLPEWLSEDSLLDLEVKARQGGQKIAVWLPEKKRLVVLFDKKRGGSWSDYDNAERALHITPQACLLFSQSLSGGRGTELVGLLIEDPDDILSYHHSHLWGGSYQEEARLYNRKKIRVRLEYFWEYYAQMSFVQIAGAEFTADEKKEIEVMRAVCRIYGGEVLTRHLEGIEVHIPLIPSYDGIEKIH